MTAPGSSLRPYVLVAFALLGLTALTVAVASVDLGAFNTLLALVIATVKGGLVAVFFMHLGSMERLNWAAAVAGLAWLALLLGLTLTDHWTRGLS